MIEFKNVTYHYSFQEKAAVKNINLQVEAGQIVLCTGASGCGKSTLMRLANGLCPQHFKGNLEGDVTIFGHNTKDTSINTLSTMVGTLFQDPEQQFFALTVDDEIAFTHECRGMEPSKIHTKIDETLKLFSIEHIKSSSIHELSEGQKQKVGLASLYSQELNALILDEPTANLDPEATLDLAQKLLALKKEGMAILIVDHRLYWLEGIADQVLVMSDGEIKEQGAYSILYDKNLCEKYGLRAAHVEDTRKTLPSTNTANTQEHGLYVQNMSFGYKGKKLIFDNSSTSLPEGITALIGENGAGKTTLARIMTGLNKVQSGTFTLAGKEIHQSHLIKHIGIVLQNADHQLHMRTVFDEVQMCHMLADEQKNGKQKPIKEKQRADLFRQETLDIIEILGLSMLVERHPQSLSGGEKQRLIIACALAKNPKILILDEPTSGLDGRNMLRIQCALEKTAKNGTCILVITHDLELIAKACTYGIHLPL